MHHRAALTISPNGVAKILEWTAAATSGDVDAQLALAWAYARGDAVDADFVTAWKWFDRAASSGQEKGVLHRAVSFSSGDHERIPKPDGWINHASEGTAKI
ncbi:TPR repeat protein [Bradyrhizobium sp. F1.13.1]